MYISPFFLLVLHTLDQASKRSGEWKKGKGMAFDWAKFLAGSIVCPFGLGRFFGWIDCVTSPATSLFYARVYSNSKVL